MINEIKDFIKARVIEVQPSFKFDGSSSDNEKIGSLQVNNTYKIVIGSFQTSRIDTWLESIVQVDVIIFKIGKNDYFNDFAKAYSIAIEIQSNIASQSNLTQECFAKEYLPKSISPEFINDDDNLMRFTISFDVRLHYKTT